MPNHHTRKSDLGVSLIELLIVMALVSILAGLILATVSRSRRTARDRKRIVDLQVVHGALQAWLQDGNQIVRPADYGESPCEADLDCSQTDLNGNGAYFVDFLQNPPIDNFGCRQFADPKNLGNCPYLDGDPRDPLGLNATYHAHYFAYRANGSSVSGCQTPFYVLYGRLETATMSDAINDQSCWNSGGVATNTVDKYFIVGR